MDIQRHTKNDQTAAHITLAGRAKQFVARVRAALQRWPRRMGLGLGVLLLSAAAGYLYYLYTPPAAFPVHTPVEIPEGMTLTEATQLLAEKEVVSSPLLLQSVIKLRFADRPIRSETFYFDRPLNTSGVAEAVTRGLHTLPPIHVTVQEGLRIEKIDELVAEVLPDVAPGDFAAAAKGMEGYLFPDTYYLSKSFTAERLVALMYETFKKRIQTLEADVAASSHPLDRIVTMASLIEREARDTESKGLVSGILWKRYEMDMPLQVDAAFEYIYDKPATQLTPEDLTVESPYNTYRNVGLPPTPIANPGLESLRAALNPTQSPYYYYITGNDGNFYYAKTYEEHQENIEAHLK